MMNHIIKESPCKKCIFFTNQKNNPCSINNPKNHCYALHGEYKLTNNSLNNFQFQQHSNDTNNYKGKHSCNYCKNSIGTGKCIIDDCIYYRFVSFDCLYLNDDKTLSLFAKQIIMNKNL